MSKTPATAGVLLANVESRVNRFYKLMKANGMMVPKRKKYSCTTTKQDKSLVPSPNLVKDMEINAPDQALCSDITYIYTEEGFLFLSLMKEYINVQTESTNHQKQSANLEP